MIRVFHPLRVDLVARELTEMDEVGLVLVIHFEKLVLPDVGAVRRLWVREEVEMVVMTVGEVTEATGER